MLVKREGHRQIENDSLCGAILSGRDEEEAALAVEAHEWHQHGGALLVRHGLFHQIDR